MAAEEAQHLFDLFDSYWFSLQILKKTQTPPPKIQPNQQSIDENPQPLDFSAVPTINIRSYSDQLLITSSNQESFSSDSPNSVLTDIQTPKLQTILSGKEVSIEESSSPVKQKKQHQQKKKNREKEKRERKRNSKSRSLSELEFEELKGFIDLGFVFSEKDKDSKLVSIIPGLQRLGKQDYHDDDDDDKPVSASRRPYLSETWDDLEYKKEEAARLMMIRIPPLGNEMEIKHQLRFWAHSVASAIR